MLPSFPKGSGNTICIEGSENMSCIEGSGKICCIEGSDNTSCIRRVGEHELPVQFVGHNAHNRPLPTLILHEENSGIGKQHKNLFTNSNQSKVRYQNIASDENPDMGKYKNYPLPTLTGAKSGI